MLQIHGETLRNISAGRRALKILAGAGLLALTSGVLASMPVLAANSTISGVVTASGTSSPIAGAHVATSPATVTATTDSGGAYSLSVPPGTYDVLFTMSGYNANFVGAVDATAGNAIANQALVPVPALAAEDLFSRPNQSGIGTASDGNTWTRDSAIYPNGTVDIVNGTALIQTVVANTDLDTWMGIAYRDQEVTADIQAVNVVTPSNAQHGGRLVARVLGVDQWIVLSLNPSDNTLAIWTDDHTTWAQSAIAPHVFSLNAWYHAKLDVIGTVAYGKAWAFGTSEPGWQVIGTGIPGSLMSSGVAGLRTGGADAYFANFLERPITQISGNVTDAGTARSLAGSTVSLNTGTSTLTDANGNYVLSNVPAGTYTVSASAAGHSGGSISNVTVSTGVSAFATNFALTAFPTPVWTSLGGTLTASPAASSSGATQTDVFVRGTDNAIWHRSWNGTVWGPWDTLGGVITADPSAVSQGPNLIDVFARGTDNAVWHRNWNGTLWSAWDRVGGVATSAPAAASWGAGRIDLVVRGTDNGLWHRAWTTAGWGAWDAIGGVATSDPAVAAWGAGRVDVFVRGTDNALWHRFGDGTGTWSVWDSLGGTANLGPNATSCASGHLDVFVRGAGNTVLQMGFNGTFWTGWYSVGGTWASRPAAACRPGTTTVDLFEKGTNNALWSTSVQGT